MKNDARKSFHHGFVLTEQELARIVDTSIEQVQKASGTKPATYFQVTFANGTVSEISSLDEILALENVGNKKIIRTRFLIVENKGEAQKPEPDEGTFDVPHFIQVNFRNTDEDDDPGRSPTSCAAPTATGSS